MAITRHRYYGIKREDFQNRQEAPIFQIDSIGLTIVDGDTIVKLSKTEKKTRKGQLFHLLPKKTPNP